MRLSKAGKTGKHGSADATIPTNGMSGRGSAFSAGQRLHRSGSRRFEFAKGPPAGRKVFLERISMETKNSIKHATLVRLGRKSVDGTARQTPQSAAVSTTYFFLKERDTAMHVDGAARKRFSFQRR